MNFWRPLVWRVVHTRSLTCSVVSTDSRVTVAASGPGFMLLLEWGVPRIPGMSLVWCAAGMAKCWQPLDVICQRGLILAWILLVVTDIFDQLPTIPSFLITLILFRVAMTWPLSWILIRPGQGLWFHSPGIYTSNFSIARGGSCTCLGQCNLSKSLLREIGKALHPWRKIILHDWHSSIFSFCLKCRYNMCSCDCHLEMPW